ncbi:type II toxin-antitoxin system PemK/MazF family toxin [Planomicrobium sp. YIM 101495]|uniref:type II toxin-antitoxin system PemK/MazF family toxin n=1 Tax=Planomicrobium sp. YIM 101495 TaxID=2665160 RepID=UPI0018A907C9|nr:type II toxin-antitoxin system PemK/MazF family toxin [Planomicrobium sp. YIM 101495]
MSEQILKAKQSKSQSINSWVRDKERLSHDFIEDSINIKSKQINIGDIYTCEIGENIGEEQCNSRPVLVVSKTFYNNHSSNVTVVPLSKTILTKVVIKNGKRRTSLKVRTHFKLKKTDFPFLDADSAVKCEQIRSISKSRLSVKKGTIDTDTLKKVQTRLKDLLDL